MKVGIIEKPGVLKVAERDTPRITSASDALVKVKRVGICGSDIHIYHGKNPFATYPRVWGHEITGEVVETGGAVKNARPGDHVVVEPIFFCGTCYACRQGRNNVCERLEVLGVHRDGGCQEYLCLNSEKLHVLPRDLPWDEAALVEPFTIGAQACYRGDVRPGDTVFVMGAGTIGLTVAINAKLAGATVIISDLFDEKLDYAARCGIDFTINGTREDPLQKVRELTGGMGANVTIDAVCVKKSFEDAIAATSAAGRVVELSFSDMPSAIAPVDIVKKEITVCGSRLQTRRFPVVIDLVAQKKLPLTGFAGKVYPFDCMTEAFARAQSNEATLRKILIGFE